MRGWIITGAVAVLFITTIALIFYKQRQKHLRLYKEILAFLNQEERKQILPLSVNDHSFSLIENQIVEMQERILAYKNQLHARELDQAQWIIDIAHQFKTPLAGLRLYCEMEKGPYQEKELHLIDHMEALLQALTKLEKLYVNAYDFVFEFCDVAGITKGAMEPLQKLFPHLHFTLKGQGTLFADPNWLEEGLTNVIKNACEHSGANQTIAVYIAQTPETLTICVEDEGGGVREEELSKLFNRFYKSGKNQNSQGIGVGLAIAKAIVEKHHGTIRAQNTSKGLKVTMKFYLHPYLLTKM